MIGERPFIGLASAPEHEMPAPGIDPADVVARQHRLTSPALGLFEPVLACAMLYSQEFKKY
jgi:hypothetical protein